MKKGNLAAAAAQKAT